MTAPSFDELARRDQENRVFAAAKPLAAMYLHHGRSLGHTCGECSHLVDRHDGGQAAGHYFKCFVWMRLNPTAKTGGAATDWRKKWDACGRFEPKKEFPMARKTTPPADQLDLLPPEHRHTETSPRALDLMHVYFRRAGGGMTCVSCPHLIHVLAKGALHYRCTKAKGTAPPDSDWSPAWAACGLHPTELARRRDVALFEKARLNEPLKGE